MGERESALEDLVIDQSFWRGKRVLITGHTGFKGGWLALWLQSVGAQVTGYALAPTTTPNLFSVAHVGNGMASYEADIRDLDKLLRVMTKAAPEVVFHLAAQSLVRYSYQNPIETYSTNVMGAVNVLQAAREVATLKAVVVITSDKCYENREWVWGYRESDPMGGYDPYSSSKGCVELVTTAFLRSFFSTPQTVGIASARAGNVIGGGDWAGDRLIPDAIRAFQDKRELIIRSPDAIRPWQHVLEPLAGYMLLAQRLYQNPERWVGGWNFGPDSDDVRPVKWIVDELCQLWGGGASWRLDSNQQQHEAHYLKLDISKAKTDLGWTPKWGLDQSLQRTMEWYKAHMAGKDMRDLSIAQIRAYTA